MELLFRLMRFFNDGGMTLLGWWDPLVGVLANTKPKALSSLYQITL